MALHALALAWLTQNHSVAPALPEVTWIEWATPEAVPIAPRMSKLASPTRLAAPPLTAQPQTPPRTMPALAQEPATAPNSTTPPGQAGAATTNDAGATAQASSGVGTTSAARPATEEVTLPSQSAAYLNNPPPAYPAISKRLGEQGRVVVRCFDRRKRAAATGRIADIQWSRATGSGGFECGHVLALCAGAQGRQSPGHVVPCADHL